MSTSSYSVLNVPFQAPAKKNSPKKPLRFPRPSLQRLSSSSPSIRFSSKLSPLPGSLYPFIWLTPVGLSGLEPPTPALSAQCSNRLSYRPLKAVCHSTSRSTFSPVTLSSHFTTETSTLKQILSQRFHTTLLAFFAFFPPLRCLLLSC